MSVEQNTQHQFQISQQNQGNQPQWKLLKLWGASASSNLADGMFQVGLSLLAVRLTRSPEAIAGILLLARLPWLLLALHAGVIADRVDRLRLLANTNLGRVALIGGLAGLTLLGVKHIVILYVVAFGLGVAETLFDTSIHSVVPMIVSSHYLERANSYMQSAELLMLQFLGPPLGGFLAGFALWLAFGASALIYLASVFLLLWIGVRLRPAAVSAQIPHSMSRDIREGLAFLWQHSLLRTFALITGALNIANGAFLAILPLYAVVPGPMKLGAAGYGLLLTGAGIGGLIAALLTTSLKKLIGVYFLLMLSISGLAIGFFIPAMTTNPLLIAGGLAITGMGIFWNVITVSIRQRIVPAYLLGRVNAAYRMCAYGALPVGAAAGGWIGSLWGLRPVFLLAAILPAMTLLPIIALARSDQITLHEAQASGVEKQLQAIGETQ